MSKKSAERPKKVVKNQLVQARLDADQYRAVAEKAVVYTKGDISKFVREAVLNYRPLKKVLRE